MSTMMTARKGTPENPWTPDDMREIQYVSASMAHDRVFLKTYDPEVGKKFGLEEHTHDRQTNLRAWEGVRVGVGAIESALTVMKERAL